MSIFSNPMAMGGFSFLGNLLEQLLNRPIVEGANRRNLARADESVGFIRDELGNIPNIGRESGLEALRGFDFDNAFRPRGPSGLGLLNRFEPGRVIAPRIRTEDYAYDPEYIRQAASEIAGSVTGSRLAPGSLFGQVDLPAFEGDARLSARLGDLAEGSERQESLASQSAIGRGLATGRDLQEITTSDLADIGLQTDIGRGRAAQQIASDLEGQEQAYNLQRGGIQAGLASTEAQINSALSQAAAQLQAQLTGTGEGLLAGSLGNQLQGRLAEAGMQMGAQQTNIGNALQLALARAGMAESGLNRQFNTATQGFNAQLAAANALANAMQGEGGLRLGGAGNMAAILAGVSEQLPLWNLGINQSLGMAMQAQALRNAQNQANQSHGGLSILGSGFNW